METKWFKEQQKRAGVTADAIAKLRGADRSAVSRIYSGKQAMSLAWAKAFAEALGHPLDLILEKAGALEGETDAARAPLGAPPSSVIFSDAIPWTELERGEAPTPLIQALGGGSFPGEIWKVTRGSLAHMGFLPGDFLIVDTAGTPRTGDVVLADVYNRQDRATVLRRLENSVLVGAGDDPASQRVHFVDGVNVAIRGKVSASWRALPSAA